MKGKKKPTSEERIKDPVSQILSKKIPYSYEEERTLLQKAKEGDRSAVNRLINMHLPLIDLKCYPYSNQGVELADLIQEAILYIIKKAIPAFKPELGYLFSSFIEKPIKWSCLSMIARHSRPVSFSPEIMNRLQFLSEILDDKTLGFSDIEERIQYVARCEGVVAEEIQKLLPYTNGFDCIMSKMIEGKLTSSDYNRDDSHPTPQKRLEDAWLEEKVGDMIKQLSQKEQEAIVYRFGLEGKPELELEEIGRIFKVSKQAIHIRIVGAFRKLRPWLEELPGLMAYFRDLEPEPAEP